MKLQTAISLSVCLLTAGLIGCQTTPDALISDQEQFTKQVPVQPNVRTIEIRHDNGSVNLKGWDRPFVLLEGYKSVTGTDVEKVRQALSEMEMIAYESGGNRLVIEYSPPMKVEDFNPFDPSSETVHFTISVPRALMTEIYNKEGAVKAADIDGSLLIEHKVGDVSIERIGGGVSLISESGNITVNSIKRFIDLDSRQGTVEIEDIDGDAVVRHRDGSVILSEVTGNAYVECDDADCTIRQIHGQLEINNEDGDVVANYIHAGVQANLVRGSLTLQPHRPVPQSYSCSVVAGDLTLRIPENSQIQLDIKAESGGIRSDFPLPISSEKNEVFATGAVNGGNLRVELSAKNGFVYVVKTPPPPETTVLEPEPQDEGPVRIGPAPTPRPRSPELQAVEIDG